MKIQELSALYVTGPAGREFRGPSGRQFGERACCCLLPSTEPRRSAIVFVEWWPFDTFILLTILCNCMTMAWQSPLDPPDTPKAAFIDVCEWVFLGIFTVELLAKMLAYGMYSHKHAYLRDAWCQLDLIVVTLAWLPILIPSFGTFSALRAFRALRPLRALKRLPGMPVLVQWILDVIPKMGNVLMLCGFVFLVFGIVGMELFKGVLHYRCAAAGFRDAAKDPAAQAPFDLETPCRADAPADSPHGVCPAGSTCEYFEQDPNYGSTSFDSVGLALIILLQGVTFDDWATPMYDLMDSFSEYAWVYFVLIVMVGGFFVVNFFLAVIFLEFATTRKRLKREEAALASLERLGDDLEAREGAPDADGSGADGGGSGGGGGGGGDSAPLLELHGAERSDGDAAVEGSPAPAPTPAAAAEGGNDNCMTAFATSTQLTVIATGLVLFNMVLMCMPYVGMSAAYEARLEQLGHAITWVFIGEMLLKLLGLGCVRYWSDGWNALDGTIVCISILEMGLTAIFSGSGVKVTYLRMLRMLRVLRVLRLMRSWRGLYNIITTFIRTIPQMSNLVILIFLTMFVFSLLGMQILGGIYNPETGFATEPCPATGCPDGLIDKPRYHFDYCLPAMITVFILLTGEWVDAMEPASGIESPAITIFFVAVVIIGKYLLMNLLIAVILTESAESSLDEVQTLEPPAASEAGASEAGQEKTGGQENGDADDPPPRASARPPRWPADYSLLLFSHQSCVRRVCHAIVTASCFDQLVMFAILISSVCLAVDTPRIDKGSELSEMLQYLDLVFAGVFISEMVLKVVALGFVCGEDTYLRSAWNVLDFTIVITMILSMLAEHIYPLQPFRVLRVLRVLRPLRLISRTSGMKRIITSLFRSMPAVSNVVGVIFVLQLIFAILGMQLFADTMGSCNNPAILNKAECIEPADGVAKLPAPPPAVAARALHALHALQANESGDDAALRRSLKGGGGGAIAWDGTQKLLWSNDPVGSFDDFGSAMRLLYVMSTGDQWERPAFLLMGATEPGVAPIRNDFSLNVFFPLLWMFVGFIFAINLFVGVVVDQFSRMQTEENGTATMTIEQQQWAATIQASVVKQPSIAPKCPGNPLRASIFHFVNSQRFDGFISLVIVLNIGVMACDYHRIEEDEQIYKVYQNTMDSFAYVYYCEFVLKLIALGPRGYFQDNWCRFDFFLVCASLLDQFATELLAEVMPLPPMLLRVLRVFRILRILRILKGAKDLRNLIVTMVLSLPSLFNVGSLLALIIFMYAVLGVNLFTFVAHAPIGSGISDERNFDSFGSTCLILFQCLTGDDWSRIMASAMLDEETSNGMCSDEEGNCGSSLAIPYFISFQIVGSFVFLNLVVAVILENFAQLHNANPMLISSNDLEMFIAAWEELDPDATNYIPTAELPELLLTLPKPIGVKGRSLRAATRLCMKLELMQHEGRVAFPEVLQKLIEYNYFQSGASELAADEFRQVAEMPEVEVPPLIATGPPPLDPKLVRHQTIDMVFAHKAIEAKMLMMLSRARMRIEGLLERLTPRSRAKLTPRSRLGARRSPLDGSPAARLPLEGASGGWSGLLKASGVWSSQRSRPGGRAPISAKGDRVPDSVREVRDSWRPDLQSEEEEASREFALLMQRRQRPSSPPGAAPHRAPGGASDMLEA